ncbi:Outer membrane protein assembly factor BamB [Symmachiella dynata]|nr:Outer membrane protein assembly factor BamB [Symmachiella dynata]
MHRMRVKFVPLVATCFAASAVLFLSSADMGMMLSAEDGVQVQRVARLPANTADTPREISPAEAQQQREALRQFVFRNRELRLWIDAAQRLMTAGRNDEALAQLQRVWEHNEDSFLYDPSQADPRSARREAEQSFEQLAVSIWRRYEVLFGPVAKHHLQKAVQDGNVQSVQKVSRDYFYTDAGFQATNRLATWWADHGNYDAAARCWDRVFESRVHARRIGQVHRVKAAIAFRRSGQSQRAEEILAGAGVVTANGTDPQSTFDNSLTYAGYNDETNARAALWPMVMGTPSRIANHAGSSPYLRPLWQHAFFNRKTATTVEVDVNEKIAKWSKDQRENGQPIAIAHYPIAVGDQVVLRDRQGIQSLDSQTGASRWNFVCESSLTKIKHAKSRGKRADWNWLLAGNASWGMLSSDGQHVFAIDELELSWNPPRVIGGKVVEDPSGDRRKSNRLIALPLQSDGLVKSPTWSVGGVESESKTSTTDHLAGHFFLGAPLPLHGRLFVVSEYRHQVKLTALDPSTGEVDWSQGIALVDMSIDQDRHRYALPCTPSYSQGILVCPTQLGVIVGVDETTGSLLWVYYYGDLLPKKQFGSMPFRRHTPHGYVGYPDLPLIAEGNVITMPRQSNFIHSIDLATGDGNWKAPRDDSEYVATVDRGTILVVGRHKCRGLDLATGEVRWEVRTGMCSGRGVQLGDEYILPLANGTVANLNIATGQKSGLSTILAKDAIGNLAVHDDIIYSLVHDRLTAFPQTEPHLQELTARISRQEASATDLLQAGELELILGRLESSKRHLRSALREEMPVDRIEDAESLLWEALYLQLHSPSTEEPVLLAELSEVTHSPMQRARYLVHKGEYELRQQHFEEAVDAALQFADLGLTEPVPLGTDKTHLVTQASWVPDFFSRMWSQADPETAGWIGSQIAQRLETTLSKRRIKPLRRFLANFANFEEADRARLLLAELELNEGRFQTAELLLNKCRRDGDYSIAATATWALAQLYADRHLYTKSAEMARDLGEHFAREEVAPGLTGAQAVQQLGRRDRTFQAALSPLRATAEITGVGISEDRSPQFQLENVYSNFWRPLNVPYDCGFDLRPTGKRRPSTDLWQVHRELGMAVGVLRLPKGAVAPSAGAVNQAFSGHFFAAGSHEGGVMHGVSLLNPAQPMGKNGLKPAEKTVSWTTVAAGASENVGTILPGPAGFTFVAFQSPQKLLVLDPATGKVRWQRNDIQPSGGLMVDREHGLFGDEDVLVMMGRDKKSFTVYETATGRELRQGTLEIELTQQRKLFGRNFLHVAQEGEIRYLRLWDPLTDEFLCNEPVLSTTAVRSNRNPLIVPVSYSNSFAFLCQQTGGLRVINGMTGRVELDVPLTAEEASGIRHLSIFQDEHRIYVNMQRHVRGAWQANSFAGETYLPHTRINGELQVYRRKDGELLWTRGIPQCVIPRIDDFQEPVLVTLSRVNWRGQFFLQVAAYHADTGELLGRRRDILSHRIVQATFDPHHRRLELRSLKNRISLQLRNQPALDSDALQMAERP